jgi:ATP-binding cassette subfamily B multidrug efflux pump
MNRGKELFRYALGYKKIIIIAMVMLAFSVGAELTGPFIAKTLIDKHVLGIESKWLETDKGKDTVFYKGRYYKRADYFIKGERKGKPAQVVQVGKEFYFSRELLHLDGKRSFKNGIVTVQDGNKRERIKAERLSLQQILAFYHPEIPRMIWLLAFYLGLLLFASGFQYGQHYFLQKAANRIIQKIRMDIFKHTQRLPIRYFDNLPAGKVVSRITNDTEAIRDLYVTVLSTFFTSSIYIGGIFIALFILNAKLAAICLLLLPILYIWMLIYRKYAASYNHIIRSKISEINASINESIQGMSIIQAFRREDQMKSEFEESNQSLFRFQNKLLNLNALTSHNLVGVLRNITFVAFIWYFGSGSIGIGSIVSLGVLYAFVDYINRLFQPVTGIVNQFANLEQALVAGERVMKLLQEEGTPVEDARIPRYHGNVEFNQVFFGYSDDHDVLKNISFQAKRGETIALVGHTGSGKSSIMNLLFRFYDSKKGEITIDGRDIRDIPVQSLREHMAIVLQDPYLFTGTIETNVSLEDPRITREMAEKALKDVGADSVLRNLEKGLDEPVIEKGSTLSSGQRQLISFARALAFDPAILILDEATSHIDTETEAIIQNAMDVLKKGRTTFIIAHRLSTIRNADQIIVLDKGMIVEKGSHDDLMALQGKYYQMYQLQQVKRAV